MDDVIEVSIPVEREAAELLRDSRTRVAMGFLASRLLCPRGSTEELAQAFAAVRADIRAAGLTDEDIDAELEAYNAEGRSRAG